MILFCRMKLTQLFMYYRRWLVDILRDKNAVFGEIIIIQFHWNFSWLYVYEN